jgi:multisubunit Na+/H+ antiporter MnhF subunit
VIDRIMAFDLITTSAVGMIVLLSIQWKTAMYLELILISLCSASSARWHSSIT